MHPTSAERSLRVVIASTQRAWHGGEEQALMLAKGLRARGHDCSVLARQGGAFARRLAAEKFAVHEFSGNGKSPWSLASIRRHLRKTAPDVLHCNESHALVSAGLASLGLPIPARIAARRLDFPIRSPGKYQRWADRVICVSTAVADVCHAGGVVREQLSIVHDGVDPSRMAAGVRERGRQSLGCADDETLLLCVAKLTDHKGHRYLLDAMPEILRQRPRVRLALVGDGELTETLQQQATRLGIQQRVNFLGFRDDVPDLLAAADYFVISSHLEGLCSSIIDAMFARRPVIATRAGGIPDLLGETFAPETDIAWIAPPKDPHALTDATLQAMASPQECARRCDRAWARAQRLFTAEVMVERTLDVYRQCVGEIATADRAAA